LAFDLIFRAKDKIKSRLIFYGASFLTGLLYLGLRFQMWKGLAGMEDELGFYSLSNVKNMFLRVIESFISLFTSAGLSHYKAEVIIGSLITSIFILLILISLTILLIKKLRDKEVLVELKVFLVGIIWILFFLLPILFPFDFTRLAYILLPGTVLVIYSGMKAAADDRTPKVLFLLVLVFLHLSLAYKAVTQIRTGYGDYGKGATFRYEKNLSLYKTWKDNLPKSVKEFWLKQLEKEE
jgi:hypothetical protein